MAVRQQDVVSRQQDATEPSWRWVLILEIPETPGCLPGRATIDLQCTSPAVAWARGNRWGSRLVAAMTPERRRATTWRWSRWSCAGAGGR